MRHVHVVLLRYDLRVDIVQVIFQVTQPLLVFDHQLLKLERHIEHVWLRKLTLLAQFRLAGRHHGGLVDRGA